MLILQNIGYTHPDKDVLFRDINLSLSKNDKAALIGNNGSGKSTLLQLITGRLQATEGQISCSTQPCYIPQVYGRFSDLSIAQALNVAEKVQALQEILAGNVTEAHLNTLNEDWTLEERCREALAYWQLDIQDLQQSMGTLSGGQKTKVFLAGITIHKPEIVLLDEPSNHLDTEGREKLYEFIRSAACTMLIVSHDRSLLDLLNPVYELSKRGITLYGGNYSFYAGQKQIEVQALDQDLKSKEKALRKAKETERESLERQQKLDARGRKKQDKAGLPTIMLNTLKNSAEKSTAHIKNVHAEKTGNLAQELRELRDELPGRDKMKFDFDNSALHKGKLLFQAENVQISYNDQNLWEQPLNFSIYSGERIALKGPNGSGKSSLIRMLLGRTEPSAGKIQRNGGRAVYIDQDYSLLHDGLSIYEQAQQFNTSGLQEHDIRIRLNRFLFTKTYWDKPCAVLSGGERMRLMLCCLNIGSKAPDLIVLDEPTNNLDMQNIGILTEALQEYEGTLIVVSHDTHFLEQLHTERTITLY
ncbi:MAG: ABC-F family ATP-binding cassette domain-containing protein [Flavobacteriales bacterium]